MWTDEKVNKVHSVHIKIDDDQFEHLSSKGNKSEYMRDLIKKDMQGGNDNTALMEVLRMALKQPDAVPAVVKPPIRLVEVAPIEKPSEPVQGNGNLLDQFGWDE